MNSILFNGQIFASDSPVLEAGNRGFKYGDGLFETMRVVRGRIPLAELHFQRLFHGMNLLKIQTGKLNSAFLLQQILDLCNENRCSDNARVRLQIFRSGINDAGYCIEAIPLSPSAIDWQERGWRIDIFPDAGRPIDNLANIKSSNFLAYVMADIYSKENSLDDSILLNVYGTVADSSRANIFLVKGGSLFTPSLTQGCVAGVMREYIIDKLDGEIQQKQISIKDLEEFARKPKKKK